MGFGTKGIIPVHATKYSWVLNLVPIVIVIYFAYLARNFQLDDALIYLRYIRNLFDGQGLVYNPGTNLNGLTSPLYTYLMIMGSMILRDLQLTSIVISAVFMVGACLVGGRLFSRSNFEAIFTASVIGAIAYFYHTFGMETPIFLFLIGLSLYLYKKESPWFIISLALLLITRSEGVFLGAVIAVDYLVRHRRLPDYRYLVAATLIVAGPFVFSYFYYGSLLPATGGAKIGQGQSGLWGAGWSFLDVGYFIPAFLKGSALAAGIFFGLALYGFYTEIRNRIVIIAGVFLALLAAFYIGLNIPNYHWYYAPFVYFMVIFASRGLWRLFELALGWRLPLRVALVFVVSTGFGYSLTKSVSLEERGANQGYVMMGNWLNENTPADSSVAMVEIGTVGWYSEREIIDILGLVSDYNAQYLANRQFMHWLLHYQPDYIIRHDPVWAHETSVMALQNSNLYEPVPELNIPGLILLKRSPTVTAEDVLAFVRREAGSQTALHAMANESERGAPFELIEGSELFAHAPSSLPLRLENDTRALHVSFGVREAALGLHSELCFEIVPQSTDQALMFECISPAENASELHRSVEIDLTARAGDVVYFNIHCPESCNYGWTYWSRVLPLH